MKKRFTLLATLMIGLVVASFAQTIVGTDPENKNVVLEEFTGIYCGYCPDGHAIAHSIYEDNPEDVVLVAIHTGGYAIPTGSDPDFRTNFGGAIAGQSGLLGYPAGTVNRHLFPGWSQGSGTALGRAKWQVASNQILGEASYLNVGCEATIITSTRQLMVYVEVYYTGDSPQSTNLLNVAILQNNISGPQSGGGAGNNYQHMHMLRHLITGQWGQEISETTEGSLYAATFYYEIPNDYRDVDVILEDLDIVAYVSETHQEVISGIVGEVEYIASLETDAGIVDSNIPQTTCGEAISPMVTIKNFGTDNLSSLDFEYAFNGGDVVTYSWTGDLAQNETAVVNIPSFVIEAGAENIFELIAENPNGTEDQLIANNTLETAVNLTGYLPQNCKVAILTDENPEETSWDIVDESGTVIASGGPYANSGIFLEEFSWPANACYTFTIYDAGGDGMPGGFYKITNSSTAVLWEGNNDFGIEASAQFAYDELMQIDQIPQMQNVSVFPNPVIETAQVNFSLLQESTVNVALYNLLGKKVIQIYQGRMPQGGQSIGFDTKNMDKGIYFVNIEINGILTSKKISVL